MRRSTLFVLLLFTLSGVSGLIYEITWIRLLSHLLGGTSFAISTVLAAFMGGLALGSRHFGKIADRNPRPLALYARLEFGIAITGLAAYLLILLAPAAYVAVARVLPGPALAVLRVIVALVLLLPPTFLMGGTLPVLARFVVTSRERMGRGLGLLYGVNTFGAVLGCFLAGFVLIGAFGLRISTFLAIAINLLIGLLILLVERGTHPAAEAVDAPEAAAPAPDADMAIDPRLLCLIFALSGFASLGYELYWSRALQHFLGNSTYAFSAMLTTFLLGLAFGGWLGGHLVDRVRRQVALLGWTQLAIGVAALSTVLLIWEWLPRVADGDWLNSREIGWTSYIARRFLVAFTVMAPTTFLTGMTFPVVTRIGVHELRRLGGGVGNLYFFNTLGAIAGSLAAGFLLLPLFGAKGALILTGCLSAAVGLAAHLGTRRRRAVEPVVAALVLLALAASAPKLARSGRTLLSDTQGPYDRVLFEREDHAAETRVYRKPDGGLHMSIDGYHIGGTEKTILRKEKILAHLPMLLAPEARSTLSVGLGSGITLGALALYSQLERLDCVEIVPSVVDGARHFGPFNGYVLDDPRTRIIVGDGVQFLLTAKERYDIISSDSKLNPQYSGNAPLLSRDYYELCRDRLTTDGVMVQWLATHLPLIELQMITRSFLAAFPHVAVFWYDPYNYVLAGSPSPLVLDMDAAARHVKQPALAADLTSLQLDDPYSIAGLYVAGKERLAADLGSSPINTWERPRLEFSVVQAYRSKRLTVHEDDDLLWLQRLFDPSELRLAGAVDEDKLERHQGASERLLAGFAMGGGSGQLNNARPRFAEGLEINPGDPRLTAVLDQLDEKDKLLEAGAASGRMTDVRARVKLGLQRYDQGRPAEALAIFDEALRERPDDANLHYNRLLTLRALKRGDDLEAGIDDFLARFPDDDRGYSLEGRQLAMAGRFEEALASFERALAIVPDSPVNRNNVAMALASLERYGEAGDAFAAVCEVSPEYTGAALSAASCYSMAGRTREAAEWMDFCLKRGLAERQQFEEEEFFANLRASEHWRD